mmetsp:Transcript_23813/g.38204  ORF Transcript_23813/g.38204 Transcript_23813/m.38204 type:complete len:272 (+) Transcript_23813:154-969(+)
MMMMIVMKAMMMMMMMKKKKKKTTTKRRMMPRMMMLMMMIVVVMVVVLKMRGCERIPVVEFTTASVWMWMWTVRLRRKTSVVATVRPERRPMCRRGWIICVTIVVVVVVVSVGVCVLLCLVATRVCVLMLMWLMLLGRIGEHTRTAIASEATRRVSWRCAVVIRGSTLRGYAIYMAIGDCRGVVVGSVGGVGSVRIERTFAKVLVFSTFALTLILHAVSHTAYTLGRSILCMCRVGCGLRVICRCITCATQRLFQFLFFNKCRMRYVSLQI